MPKKKARREPIASSQNAPQEAESPVVSDDDGVDVGYKAQPGAAEQNGNENDLGIEVEQLSDSGAASDDANEGRGWVLEHNSDADSDSGSSSDGDMNPVGDIPMRWYDGYEHIGYDRKGKKIVAENKPTALDLAADPHAWRKIYDEKNDEMIELTHAELKQIARLRAGKFPSSSAPNITYEAGGDDANKVDNNDEPYEVDEVVKWSGPVEQQPMPSGTEPKRRFIPSRHEARLVVKMVRAMRAGHLNTDGKKKDSEFNQYRYDIWADHEPKTLDEMSRSERFRDSMRVPAPKPPLPNHAESYNPPMEYLPSKGEQKKFRRIPESARRNKFLPQKFSSLRHVPRYDSFVRERFERCLDLYLAIRVATDKSRQRLEDVDEIVQNIPKPADLRPFPTDCVATFRSLPIRARSFDLHPSGKWLVCGCDDGCVRILDAVTGYVRKCWNFVKLLKLAAASYIGRDQEIENFNVGNDEKDEDEDEDDAGAAEPNEEELLQEKEKEQEMKITLAKSTPVNSVGWCPRSKAAVFAAVVGNALIVTDASRALGVDHEDSDAVLTKISMFGDTDEGKEKERAARQSLREAGIVWHDLNFDRDDDADNEEDEESFRAPVEEKKSKMIIVQHGRPLRTLSWHRKGDYLSCVGRDGNNGTVYVHRVSRRATQVPFKQSTTVQCVKFHPNRPFFLVATMHYVRIYNLAAQKHVKTLKPGVSWISSIDIHPGSGDHVLVTSYDRRVCWFDLDLSVRPYKTIRNHLKAVRVAKFHPRLPLFVSADDDAQCHVFHSTVYDDLSKMALIVPVKVLHRCSGVRNALGVLDVAWHPTLPLLYTCGADGTLRLYADCSQGQTQTQTQPQPVALPAE